MHSKRSRTPARSKRHRSEPEKLLAAAVIRAEVAEQRANKAESREKKAATEAKLVRERLESNVQVAVNYTDIRVDKVRREMNEQLQQVTHQRGVWETAARQTNAQLQCLRTAVEEERQEWAKDKEALECTTVMLEEEGKSAVQEIGRLKASLLTAEEEAVRYKEMHECELQSVQQQLKAKEDELGTDRRSRDAEAEMTADRRRLIEVELSERSEEQRKRFGQQVAEMQQKVEEAERHKQHNIEELRATLRRLESEAEEQRAAAVQQTQQHAEMFFQQEKRMGSELKQCEVELRTEKEHTERLTSLMRHWLDRQEQAVGEERGSLELLCAVHQQALD